MELLYPKAEFLDLTHALGKGALRATGATIHYAADRNFDRVIRTLKETGFGYHVIIDRTGKATQLVPFNHKTWHAGRAEWRGVSPNSFHVSICLLSWGQLTEVNGKFLSWAKYEVDAIQVAKRFGFDHNHGVKPWDAFTSAQESRLIHVLSWLVSQGVHTSSICGHDECCIPQGRKIDPGGSLSMSMADLRKALSTASA